MRDMGQQLQQQQETEEEKARDASSRDLARSRATSHDLRSPCKMSRDLLLDLVAICRDLARCVAGGGGGEGEGAEGARGGDTGCKSKGQNIPSALPEDGARSASLDRPKGHLQQRSISRQQSRRHRRRWQRLPRRHRHPSSHPLPAALRQAGLLTASSWKATLTSHRCRSH